MTAMQTYDAPKSRIASIVLLSLVAAACGKDSDEQPAQRDAGADTGGRPGGGKGGAGVGGKGGEAGTALPMMMITCTETAPTTPVMCGGEVCQAPAQFAGNPCIVPCCIMQGDEEVCASKSTAEVHRPALCALPAVPDPQCPDIDAMATPRGLSMGIGGGTFTGCCNAGQHKCGAISGIRPGCITESLTVTFPSDPPACSEAPDDGGTDLDGG